MNMLLCVHTSWLGFQDDQCRGRESMAFVEQIPRRENAMRSMFWRANEIVYISKYVCTIYVGHQ